jgi:hypothetical protein
MLISMIFKTHFYFILTMLYSPSVLFLFISKNTNNVVYDLNLDYFKQGGICKYLDMTASDLIICIEPLFWMEIF